MIILGFRNLSLIFNVLFRHDGTDSPADAGDVIVVLNSFHSKIIKVRVSFLDLCFLWFLSK